MENLCWTNIFMPRILKAILSSTVVQYLLLIGISFPMKIKFWHPETWFRTFIDTLYTTGLSYLIPFGIILTALTFIYFEKIETGVKYFPNRFSMIYGMFSIRNFAICCVHTVIGGIVYYIYVRNFLGRDYGGLSTNCKEMIGSTCLVESHVYLILCGIWTGFYSYLQAYIGTKILVFPVVQQSKLVQVKSQLKATLKQAMTDAVSPSLVFAGLYYLRGESVRDQLGDFLDLQLDEASTSSGIMHLLLIMYSWLIAAMFLLTLYMVKLILQVFLTDHITFPITAAHGMPNCITLSQALHVTKPQAMQFLGFQDLMVLAEKDRHRRQELFSLSQPGGHPHNWNAISEVCLKLLNTFTADLHKSSMEPQAIKANRPHTPVSEQSCSMGTLRNLSMQNVENIRYTGYLKSPKSSIVNTILTRAEQLRQVLLKKPGISYLFSELPDAKVQHCISNSQHVIWACQSLALLAAASFQEDKYGVLQKDLPAIITGLLQLKQILDQLQKPGSQKKSRCENFETKMKHALRSAVRRSMYRITVTFGTYLEDLPLASDVLQQVQNFIRYRD